MSDQRSQVTAEFGISHLVRPATVAEYLDTTEAHLSQMRYHGNGPAFVKVGKAVRYRLSDVDAWLAAQTRTSTQSA